MRKMQRYYVVQNVWQFMFQHIHSHASVSLNFKYGKLLHVCNWLKQVPWRLNIKSRSCSRFFRLQTQFGGTIVITNQKWFQHTHCNSKTMAIWTAFCRKYSTYNHTSAKHYICTSTHNTKAPNLSINWQICFKCFIMKDTFTTMIT